jgi:two-component system sensor histidine kinase DesK
MITLSERLTRWRGFLSPREPWIDLVYLGFFFFRWLWTPPTLEEAAFSLAALGVFLVGYVVSMRRRDWTVLVAAGASVLIGFWLVQSNFGGAVLIVFAAPMIARLPDQRLRAPALIGYGPLVLVLGLATGLAWYLLLAIFFLAGVSALSAGAAARRAEGEAAEETRRVAAEFAAAEAERGRIARDLHDLLGHSLSVIALKADLAQRLSESAPEKAAAEIASIQEISRKALAEVREAVSGLRDWRLVEALGEAAERLREAGLEVSLEVDEIDLSPEIAQAFSMMAREASTNILRHAGAQRVAMVLRRTAEGVELRIRDDGAGGADPLGGGLSAMRRRLADIGAELQVGEGEDGRGVELAGLWPAEAGLR